MTRKDYVLIAGVIRDQLAQTLRDTNTVEVLYRFAHSLAWELKKENPKFNPEIFLRTAGVKD